MAKQKQNVIGIRLRHCRTNCRLSQQQVADALGINRTTYTYYESGRFEPSLHTIVKLAQIFCVDISELLPGENPYIQLKDPNKEPINPIYSLSKEEQNLLLSFRLLKDEDKAEILDKITNMTTEAI
ncbi:MAG: helix-turn-helix transcriptional regulator [Ruminococcus sp.]|nr:helix-turn-helix transcriptional regulator [Ruminococcus sp.]